MHAKGGWQQRFMKVFLGFLVVLSLSANLYFLVLKAEFVGSSPLSKALVASGPAVATMGNIKLSVVELQATIDALDKNARDQLKQDKTVLENLIREETLSYFILERAVADGLSANPKAKLLIDRLTRNILVNLYFSEKMVVPTRYPPENEVADAYAQNKDKFRTQPQFHVAQIFVAVPGDADAERVSLLESRAQKLMDQATKGADFGQLARDHSEHKESLASGGDLGWLAEGNLVPEIKTEVVAMKVGQVAGPVRTPQGWHIVKLLDARGSSVLALDQVKGGIVEALRKKKLLAMRQAHLAQLAAENSIHIDEKVIKQLNFP